MQSHKEKAPSAAGPNGACVKEEKSRSRQRDSGALVTIHKLAGGRFFLYHAADDWLVNAGLIRPHELPPSVPGHIKVIDQGNSLVQAVRQSDGRVGLTLDAETATDVERPYLRFMASVLESEVLSEAEQRDLFNDQIGGRI